MYHTKLAGLNVTMRKDNKMPRDLGLENLNDKSIEFLYETVPALRKGEGKFYVDIGCGYGYAGKKFEETGASVKGVDLYPPVSTELLIETIKIDWESLEPFILAYGQADLVFFNHGIEHALSVYRTLEQIRNLTKIQGYLYLGFPHGMFPWAYELDKSTTHFSIITPEFIEVALKRYGFEVIRQELRGFRKNYIEVMLVAKRNE